MGAQLIQNGVLAVSLKLSLSFSISKEYVGSLNRFLPIHLYEIPFKLRCGLHRDSNSL